MDSTAERKPAAAPAWLRGHELYRGGDPTAAHDIVAGTIDPHELRVTGRRERLDTRLYGATVGAVALCYLHYGTDVEITAPGSADCVCVHFPLGGVADVRCGSDRIVSSPALGAVPNPIEPLRMRWSAEAAHLIIRVDRETLESRLRNYLGTTSTKPIRTDLALSLRGPSGSRWLSILELLQAEIALGDEALDGVPMSDVRGAAIEDLVINSLLLAHPNNFWPLLARRRAPARSPYVRRAVEFIRENLDAPITTALLAEVTGVSGRSLQAGFARELGCPPSAYVRDQRLARAQAELAAAGFDEGVTVTDVALRSGFSHLGRFSSAYRRRFGELPSVTLRRSPERGERAGS